MNVTACCIACRSLLEENDAFPIDPDEREEFFECFGQPLRCPQCSKFFAVEGGVPAYEVTADTNPCRTFSYARHNADLLFVANIWPTPDTMGAIFRLEDMAEAADGRAAPVEDMELGLAESDLQFIEPILKALAVCRSVGIIGEAWVCTSVEVRGSFDVHTESSRLYYHELCRRVFAFYERGAPIWTKDSRFYRLVWKAMQRIYKRHLGRTRRAFEEITALDFLQAARDWAKEQFGPRMIVTPAKIRAIRAIIEHCALASVSSRA